MGRTAKVKKASRTACDKKQRQHNRVLRLAGVGNVTDSALGEIMQEVSDEPLSRHQVKRSLATEWQKIRTTISLDLEEGKQHSWEHCRLDLLFAYFCNCCVVFTTMLSAAVARARTLSLI